MGIDEVGIDKVGIDEVGRYRQIQARLSRERRESLASETTTIASTEGHNIDRCIRAPYI